jgi:hypothetical protein
MTIMRPRRRYSTLAARREPPLPPLEQLCNSSCRGNKQKQDLILSYGADHSVNVWLLARRNANRIKSREILRIKNVLAAR